VLGSGRRRSLKAQVSSSPTLERDSLGSHDVRVDRLSRGNQPDIVLAQPTCGAMLRARTLLGLRQMHSLDREPLQ